MVQLEKSPTLKNYRIGFFIKLNNFGYLGLIKEVKNG